MPTLAEKMAACCKRVSAIKVEGDNLEYTYLRILDLANALRESLFAAGIIIIPNDLEVERTVERSQIADRWWTEYRVKTDFTITDGCDELRATGYGVGRDMDGKALAIAQTYALKSFLKRLGLIFGDYDDPEKRADDITDLRPDLQKEIDGQKPFTPTQKKDYERAMCTHGRTTDEEKAFMEELKTPDYFQRRDFLKVMAWAMRREYDVTA